jgi:hypothetical protein
VVTAGLGRLAADRKAPRTRHSSKSSLESRALSCPAIACVYWFYGDLTLRAEKSSRPVRGASETLLELARSRRALTGVLKSFFHKTFRRMG